MESVHRHLLIFIYIVMMEEKEVEMHFLCPAICFLEILTHGHKRAKKYCVPIRHNEPLTLIITEMGRARSK